MHLSARFGKCCVLTTFENQKPDDNETYTNLTSNVHPKAKGLCTARKQIHGRSIYVLEICCTGL